jgi:hypothetical protein
MAQLQTLVQPPAKITSKPWARNTGLYLASLLIGIAAGHGILALMPCTFLFIAMLRLAPTRWARLALAHGYYGGFTITMFPGAAIFFGHDFNPFGIALLWTSISLALSLPWVFLCNPQPIRLAWAVPACVALETLPPLGLIAVGNPLNTAGILFPHAGWFGLALLFILCSLPAVMPRYTLPTIAILTGLSVLFVHGPKPPADWIAIDTQLGGQGLDVTEGLRNYQAGNYIQIAALKSSGTVILFPESLLRWNTAAEAFWKPTLDRLHSEQRTMILGATIAIPLQSGDFRKRASMPLDYRNVALFRGLQTDTLDQRIPIPVTMWNPFSSPSVPLNLFGPSVVSLDGQRAAIEICYEQLLSFALMESMSEHPTLIVGMANDYWAKGTYFPAIQLSNLQAWGQLFNVPVITAINE